jgi:nitrile hydratase
MGMTGAWNLDMSRAARETLSNYASLRYYEVWVEALRKLLLEHSLVGEDELAAGRMLQPPRAVARVPKAADIPGTLTKGSSSRRAETRPARFAAGDRVRARRGEVDYHTRLPRYARGKVGTVEQLRGVHVYADANAQGLGEQPQWLYTVVFDGRELWGERSDPRLTVSIDAWEPYLEAAT